MNPLHYFSPQPGVSELPKRLPDPFNPDPHPLAERAGQALQQAILRNRDLQRNLFTEQGKMFGVLVVSDANGRIGYLAGFSGQLQQQWAADGYVPPLFDTAVQNGLLAETKSLLQALSDEIEERSNDPDYRQLQEHKQGLEEGQACAIEQLRTRNTRRKRQRHAARSRLTNNTEGRHRLHELDRQSQQDKIAMKALRRQWRKKLDAVEQPWSVLQGRVRQLKLNRERLTQTQRKKMLDLYRVSNSSGEMVTLRSLFKDKPTPDGAGDCAAPRLLQYALTHALQPLALSELWVGKADAGEIRHDGYFYPPCRGKCRPLLDYQLRGIEVERSLKHSGQSTPEPDIVYEDDHLVVINKPPGLLSVPGKARQANVQDWLRHRYPGENILLLHRLDMATSGLLMASRHARAHKRLQQQFIQRSIQKRYVALLSKPIAEKKLTIQLPLRVDLDDRPRQRVCERYGKPAVTDVEVLATSPGFSRVHFYPRTGRSHQLRAHAAHPGGLNAPIIGDELYGKRAQRLMLHAERLVFKHPQSGQTVMLEQRAPF